MEYKEWFQETNNLLNYVIDKLPDSIDKVTPADVGLILHVYHDHLKDKEKNLERDIETLKLAEQILESKYRHENISWFDIYDCILEPRTKIKKEKQKTNKKPPDKIEDIFTNTQHKNLHQKGFHTSCNEIFDILSSEKAEELKTDQPEDFKKVDQFACSVSNRSDIMYGLVEIPNNKECMNLCVDFSKSGYNLSELDYEWMINSIKKWMKLYVRAEATIANRKTERKQLHKFMLEEETPKEKYWDY